MRLSRFLPLGGAALLVMACSGEVQPTEAALQEAEDSDLVVQPLDLTVGDIEEDADLLNQAGEEVGAIEVVLVDASGRPVAIAAEVGSFQGASERSVVISLDRLQANPEDDLVTTLTKEELLRLPAWDG
jgi:hypothetical protein